MPFDAPTPPDTETSLLIERAMALIANPKRWGKGSHVGAPRSRKHCMAEALVAANGYRFAAPFADAREALERAVAARTGHPYVAIHPWNDAPATTHADVLAVMREAAMLAKAGPGQ